MLIAGVDEAGRGCVIGPLVVAGVAVQTEKMEQLAGLGVKDSKLLTAKKREELYPQILNLVSAFNVQKLQPSEIDVAVDSGRVNHKLNRLEAQTMAKVIDFLNPNEVYVDAADVVEEKFKNHISECLACKPKIISKHKADRLFPVVSAASIIAKVTRDRDVAVLREKFGDFGSGYLTDEKTGVFLKKWVESNSEYPEFVRKSWKPAKRMLSEKGTMQTLL
jgi:ribonuclease HII